MTVDTVYTEIVYAVTNAVSSLVCSCCRARLTQQARDHSAQKCWLVTVVLCWEHGCQSSAMLVRSLVLNAERGC